MISTLSRIAKTGVRRGANKLGFDVHRLVQPTFPVRMDVPELLQKHIASAKLYADREAPLKDVPKGGTIAEIGTALGDFTATLLSCLAPSRFDAFDLFRLHENGFSSDSGEGYQFRSPREIFGGQSHREFYDLVFRPKYPEGFFTSTKETVRQSSACCPMIVTA